MSRRFFPGVGMSGPKKVEAWRRKHGLTYREMGALLGVAPTSVDNWVIWGRRPAPHMQRILKKVCGISVDSWLSKEEREVIRDETARILKALALRKAKP